jgi:hypothetical protein
MADRTDPDEDTRAADEADIDHAADRPPTDDEATEAEAYAADEDPARRADVAAHEKEMMEIGANIKGEGAID